jgi:hypothetical protein
VGIDDVLVQSPRCHSLAELGDVMRIVQEMNVLVKTCQTLASQYTDTTCQYTGTSSSQYQLAVSPIS